MKREEAKKWLSEITAFAEGKDIQFQYPECDGDCWADIDDISIDEGIALRIKPQPEVIWVNKSKETGALYFYGREEEALNVTNLTTIEYEYIAKRFIEAPEDDNG